MLVATTFYFTLCRSYKATGVYGWFRAKSIETKDDGITA